MNERAAQTGGPADGAAALAGRAPGADAEAVARVTVSEAEAGADEVATGAGAEAVARVTVSEAEAGADEVATGAGAEAVPQAGGPPLFRAVAGVEDIGARLDVFLAGRMADVSRSYAQGLITQGAVTVNGAAAQAKRYNIKAGDVVEAALPMPELLKVEAEDIPLRIVYEDDELLVIDKDKGMVVHPAPGNESGTLVNAVMFHCGGRLSAINGVARPGIVHRIDKDTSGLLLVAKTDMAHRALAGALAAHEIVRKYEAVAYSNFMEDEGKVDLPLGRDPRNRLRQAVVSQNGRRAVTHYWVKERFGDFTHIELSLETGRTHQIRVHMAYIKHPLLGDPLYGPKNKPFGVETQMLHAGTLGFRHPKTGGYMEFSSPLPEGFAGILEKLRAKSKRTR
ncbi:MAG: RluA family pseudouridine synthase [Clostridiales Family XIII bacterium]|nr:RluA family pseudouridine synthase [Clostridiales Family XIII bacterium]